MHEDEKNEYIHVMLKKTNIMKDLQVYTWYRHMWLNACNITSVSGIQIYMQIKDKYIRKMNKFKERKSPMVSKKN